MATSSNAFIATGTRHLFRPDFIANSVADIDFGLLKKMGVTAAFIDLDGTVVERRGYDVDATVRRTLRTQSIKIYIATNRPMKRDLKDLVQSLNAEGVIHPQGFIGKPFPRYYKKALRRFGLKPTDVVMIGDRLLQDIWGANAAGLRTVAVKKLGKPVDWFDARLSAAEARYLSRLQRKQR